MTNLNKIIILINTWLIPFVIVLLIMITVECKELEVLIDVN